MFAAINELANEFLTALLSHMRANLTSDAWKYDHVVKETVTANQNLCTCKTWMCVWVQEGAFVHPGIASVTQTCAHNVHASHPPSFTPPPFSVSTSIHLSSQLFLFSLSSSDLHALFSSTFLLHPYPSLFIENTQITHSPWPDHLTAAHWLASKTKNNVRTVLTLPVDLTKLKTTFVI